MKGQTKEMDVLEIVLLIAGGIIFILSFLLPAKEGKNSESANRQEREEVRQLVAKELEAVRGHVDEVVDEAVGYAMEKTERSLERLSNEKIMAVNEYSDTVLAEIHKNHEEAMFLYDMLNSKHMNLKDTVSEVNRTVKEAEETVINFQKLMPEAEDTLTSGKDVSDAQEAAGNAASAAEKPEEEVVAGRNGFMGEDAENGRNNNGKIMELYRQGKSSVAIAKELGLGVGEVNLVIGLHKNQ